KGGLVEVMIKPRELTPQLLLGGKGSGKTHVMRYCSAAVQIAQWGSLKAAIDKEGFLGIYIPAEGLNTHKFSGKGQSEEAWDAIFATYFEIWIATTFLEVLAEAKRAGMLNGFDEGTFSSGFNRLFDIAPDPPLKTLESTIEHLVKARKH